MSEPRRSTRARAREEAAVQDIIKDHTPSKPSGALKRKRASLSTNAIHNATTVKENLPIPQRSLPVRLLDGYPLPTLSKPQSLSLPQAEYQDIQQSGVLHASLTQSRAVWVSGVNFRLFHALFTAPKKVADRTELDKQCLQRQKEIVRNFPQVGEAQLVIEPHTFPIRLYGPRELTRQLPKKAPTYGQWPNHNHQQPYQYNHRISPAPYQPPQVRPPQSNPPAVPPPAPATPQPAPSSSAQAPDPVIHMLAQRAGQDSELKAVMKVVAAGQATKEQLEFFQGHINQLTTILHKQKDEAKASRRPSTSESKSQQPPPASTPKPDTSTSQQAPQVPAQTQHQGNSIPQTHAISPTLPPPVTPATPYLPQNFGPAPYNQPPHYRQHQHHQVPQYAPSTPPARTFRPLVFDFVEGNGDKFYFPAYSFLEWLPKGQGTKFSFLITKLKPKSEIKSSSAPLAFAPPPSAVAFPPPSPINQPPAPFTPNIDPNFAPNPNVPSPIIMHPGNATPYVTPYIPPPRIEDFDERGEMEDIEFHQPVTVLILSSNMDVLQALPRAIRPPDVVEKYMNDVFDRTRRAQETYLAFRLPKERALDVGEDVQWVQSVEATPAPVVASGQPFTASVGPVVEKRKAGRPRKNQIV